MQHITDPLFDKKWGVFVHYLYNCQNNPLHPASMGKKETSWEECVNELDTNRLAEQLSDTGAGYLIFTVMQGTRYFCTPNDTFNRISGYKPTEACASRDIPQELYESLSKYGIDLYLYYTGDGPHIDPVAGPRFGFVEPRKNVQASFVEKWAMVLKEFSDRYRDQVKGWWIDGCYAEAFGYDEALLKILADAARSGNQDTLLAFNDGVKDRVVPYSKYENYTCGEMNDFVDLPDARFVDGEQWHILAPLGLSPDGIEYNSWCRPGVKRTGEYMRTYVDQVNQRGGVVSIDILLKRDGSLESDQINVLKEINKR